MKYILPLILVFQLISLTAWAEPEEKPDRVAFMKLHYLPGKKLPVSMDTAVIRFADEKDELQVDLIAAVHIGDQEYYEQLNELFTQYDVLLYELVAEKGAVPGKLSEEDKKKKSLLSGFQAEMGKTLDLDFQLHHIDYTAKNFVHADLSPEEFAERVGARGDLIQIIYRALILGARQEKTNPDGEMKLQGKLLATLFSRNPSLSLKRVLVTEMIEQMDDSIWLIGGEGSAILTDRNNAALEVLREQIEKGHSRIGIFYGGAHLPDLAKKLNEDFHLKQQSTNWIIAWDLTRNRTARKKIQPPTE